jgi:hypothetical protein
VQAVHLGTWDDCYPGARGSFLNPFALHAALNVSACFFTALFQLYEQPPAALVFGGLWTWGNVAFVGVVALWAFVALLLGRAMHLLHTARYYFHASLVTMRVRGSRVCLPD